jgi:hypothetical protein
MYLFVLKYPDVVNFHDLRKKQLFRQDNQAKFHQQLYS